MMEPNMFTDEQLDILRKGFQEHDFTQAVPLSPTYEDMTPKQSAAFVALKTRIMDYAKANLPALDIKRKISNFTGDFPVNLLLEADSTYIANEAVNILSDAQRTLDAIFVHSIRCFLKEPKKEKWTARGEAELPVWTCLTGGWSTKFFRANMNLTI